MDIIGQNVLNKKPREGTPPPPQRETGFALRVTARHGWYTLCRTQGDFGSHEALVQRILATFSFAPFSLNAVKRHSDILRAFFARHLVRDSDSPENAATVSAFRAQQLRRERRGGCRHGDTCRRTAVNGGCCRRPGALRARPAESRRHSGLPETVSRAAGHEGLRKQVQTTRAWSQSWASQHRREP